MNPADVYLFKVNNRNIRKICETCSKLTIKTPERRHWRRSGVFIVNFEHILQLFLVFLLLTLNLIQELNWYLLSLFLTLDMFGVFMFKHMGFILAVNPFQANIPFLFPLKTSEKLQIPDISRGFKMGTLAKTKLRLTMAGFIQYVPKIF